MPRYALLLLLALAGCARDPVGLPLTAEHDAPPPKLQYLGVGGYLMHWRGEGLLIAPSFSNPSFLGLPPLQVKADEATIDARMPPADDVSMLLIGHAHYDHLLDVPRVMQKQAPNAIAYGSATAGHILRAVLPAERIVNAEPAMANVKEAGETGKAAQPGTWLYSRERRFRAMPIQSMHAPHIAGITLLRGSYDQDLKELPTAVWNWKEGQTLAWLVDLLDETGKPVYRIHYQDSASSPPYGFPPILADGKAIDVEILCVGSWNQVQHYPDALLKVSRPRLVVLGHWEDFFGNDPQKPQTIRLLDEQGMVKRTRAALPTGTPVVMPVPLSEVALPAAL